jgi:hypothetical protein
MKESKVVAVGLVGGVLAVLCCALPALTLAGGLGVGLALLHGVGAHWPVVLAALLVGLGTLGALAGIRRKSKSGCHQHGCCTPTGDNA